MNEVRRSHFRFVRTSGVLCVSCWCGKVAALETRNINVFTRRCNDFLYDHTYCEQFVKAKGSMNVERYAGEHRT